jgi:RNA polymerase sigma-70 factor (ECF subfamily)
MLTINVSERTDAELAALCRAGDEDAWRELVERFSRYVYAITTQGFRLAPDEADDVFQDVFARAYERLDTLRSDEALRPWIGQLARRCCLDRLRSRARERPAEPDALEEAADDDVLAKLEEAIAVHEALDALSPDCQEVLDRFFCRDESYRTIGDELGLPGGTIASRISRCLTRLREVFEGRPEAPAASSEQVTR